MQTGTLSQQFAKPAVGRLGWLLVVIGLVCAACVTDDSGQVGQEPVTYQVTWLVTPEGAVGPTRAVLRLDEEFAVLDGNTGCHRILGSFTLNDTTGEASFTVPGSSQGSCQPSDNETEEWLLAGLDRVSSFQRVDRRLELADSAGALQIQLEPLS